MVNTDIPAGTYAIRPKDGPQDLYLTVGPHTAIFPLPDAIVDLGDKFAWVLKDTDTGTSTVHAKQDGYRWITKDHALFVSATKDAVEFNFERDDSGFVFVDIPGIISNRLTYNKHASPSEPIFFFKEADDSSVQLFEIQRLDL